MNKKNVSIEDFLPSGDIEKKTANIYEQIGGVLLDFLWKLKEESIDDFLENYEYKFDEVGPVRYAYAEWETNMFNRCLDKYIHLIEETWQREYRKAKIQYLKKGGPIKNRKREGSP